MDGNLKEVLCNDMVLQLLRTKLNGDFELLSYKINPANVLGIMGQYVILNTRSKIQSVTRDDSFFIKSLPVNDVTANYASEGSIFKNEMFIYRLMKINPVLPECYYISNQMAVLENLNVHGYKTLDRIVDSLEVIKVVINSLAEFHAASIIVQETRPNFNDEFKNNYKDSLYDESSESRRNIITASIKGLSAAVDLFKLDPSIKEVIAKNFPKIFKLAKPSWKYRNVIIHSDLWSANILMKYADGKPQHCKIIDYQLIRLAPPAQDLMSLLFLVTTREFRRKHEDDVVNFYYTTLTACLKRNGVHISDVISKDEFYSSCKEQKEFGVIQAAHYFTLTMLNEESKEKLLADPALMLNAFEGDRSLMFPFAEGDDVYFNRIKESILDIVDYFEK